MNKTFKIKIVTYAFQKADTPEQAVIRAKKKGHIREHEIIESVIKL